MSRPDLLQQVRETVKLYNLPLAGARVAAAVSGGADSLALLHAMLRLREELGIREVAALHIHHGLRGAEASRDEETVRTLCARWEVPYTPYFVDAAAEAARCHEGEEAAGRRLRYAVYAQWTVQGWLVLTGHTRSDTAETVLLHMTRGCGIAGLAGIPPMRDGVCRPLLGCSREDTERYCREQGIPYVTDSTNSEVRYARNRVRLTVMPELRQINPQAEEALVRLAAHARETEELLEALAREWLQRATLREGVLSAEVLREAPPLLARTALRLALPPCDMEQKHWEALYALLQAPGAVTLPGGRTVRSTRRQLCLGEEVPPPPFRYPVTPGESVHIGRHCYTARVYPCPEFFCLQKVHKKLFSFSCSYDIIKDDLYVRQRQDGDRYRPVGRGGKTLRKLWNEAGLSACERAELPVLCDGSGILLVPGFGCDERAAVTEQTQQVLVFAPSDVYDEASL